MMHTQQDNIDWRDRAEQAETTLQKAKAYIEVHEHPDDWGVPCVYTKNLHVILGTQPADKPKTN